MAKLWQRWRGAFGQRVRWPAGRRSTVRGDGQLMILSFSTAWKSISVAAVLLVMSIGQAFALQDRAAISSHLEFLGYTIEDLKDEGVRASHPTYFNAQFRDYRGGILVSLYFTAKAKASEDRLGFHEVVNTLNQAAIAARYYVDDDDNLRVEAYYPGTYERQRFATFLTSWNDITAQIRSTQEVLQYVE